MGRALIPVPCPRRMNSMHITSVSSLEDPPSLIETDISETIRPFMF